MIVLANKDANGPILTQWTKCKKLKLFGKKKTSEVKKSSNKNIWKHLSLNSKFQIIFVM
jgi:hypothetical protein